MIFSYPFSTASCFCTGYGLY